MARIFRHTSVEYWITDTDGNPKKVPKNTPGAKKKTRRTRKYYIEYRDRHGIRRRVPGYTDRRATEQLAAELERREAQGTSALENRHATHLNALLTDHINDYLDYLASREVTPRHAQNVRGYLERLAKATGARQLKDFTADKIQRAVADLRRPGDPPNLILERYTLAEACAVLGVTDHAFRKLVSAHRLPATGAGKSRRFPRETVAAVARITRKGISPQTANYYLGAAKAFGAWLLRSRRLPENPFASLETYETSTDRRHDRRDLSAEELRRLLQSTRESPAVYRGLTGYDRHALYATACGTGFRAAALASLTPEAFDLDAGTVSLAARAAKNRRAKVQPITEELAAILREYLATRSPCQPVWPGTWASQCKAAEMLRIDLEAASIPYAVPGPDGPLYVDFHALRHTYLTLLSLSGVDLRTAQELAGHSTPVLTARYSHRRLSDLSQAVAKLPALGEQTTKASLESENVQKCSADDTEAN